MTRYTYWLVTICLLLAGRGVAFASLHGQLTGRTFRVFQVPPTEQGREPPVVTAVAVQSEGTLLAVGGDDHDIHVWEVGTGKLVRKLKGHSDWVRCLAFAPDNRTLASAGNDGRVLLWSVDSDERPREFSRHDHVITGLQFAARSQRLATIGFQQKLKLYNSLTGELVQQFSCPCKDMRAVAFSRDEGRLAVGGRNGLIRVWNLSDGTIAFEVKAHRQRIRAIAYSPDGSRIVSAGEDRQLRIGRCDDGSEIRSLPCQGTKVLAISFLTADQVAVAGSDNRIHVWNIKDGRREGLLVGHTGSVTSLQSSGNWVASGSYDTTVRVWHLQRLQFDNHALRFAPHHQVRRSGFGRHRQRDVVFHFDHGGHN